MKFEKTEIVNVELNEEEVQKAVEKYLFEKGYLVRPCDIRFEIRNNPKSKKVCKDEMFCVAHDIMGYGENPC